MVFDICFILQGSFALLEHSLIEYLGLGELEHLRLYCCWRWFDIVHSTRI